MKRWQFDITETSQILYCVNLLLIFTGYVGYKYNNRLNDNVSYYYEVIYLIVIGFGIVVHLLHFYNNFHTERLVNKKIDNNNKNEKNMNQQ